MQEGLHSRCGGYESFRALAVATLLDPRFKNVAFGNPAKAQEAEKHITLECASLMRSNTATPGEHFQSSSDIMELCHLKNDVTYTSYMLSVYAL